MRAFRALSPIRRLVVLSCLYGVLALLVLGGVAMAAFACLSAPWGARPVEAALNAGAGIAIAAAVAWVCAFIGMAFKNDS